MKKTITIILAATFAINLLCTLKQAKAQIYISVPDVVGMNTADAVNLLNSIHLEPVVFEIYSESVPVGQVISQNPIAYTSVVWDSWVELFISKGPSPKVEVPNVVGMSKFDAQSAITSVGLGVTFCYEHGEEVEDGLVISQNPPGGAQVPPDTSILITIDQTDSPSDPDPDPPASDPPVPDTSFPVPPDDSCLVAHWKLDDGSGNTAIDSSDNGFDITLKNTTWENGMFGGSVHFHGIGAGEVSNFHFNENAITLCAWVFHDEFRINKIERYVTVSGSSLAVIRKEGDGSLHFYISPEGNIQHLWVNDVLTQGQWHHVTGTWDGLNQRLYIDGVEIASQTPGVVFSSASHVAISSEGESLNGMLDDIRIYNCALSADNILSLLYPEPTECLIAHWELDEISDPVAYDSVSDNDGTLHGNPIWRPMGGMLGGALEFDGLDDYVFIGGSYKLPVYTIAMWFRADGGSGQRDIFSAYAPGAQHGILLEITEDGTLRYLHRYPLGIRGGTNIYTTNMCDNGAWHHVAMVKSTDMIALYINGEEVGSAADNSEFGTDDIFGVVLGILDNERAPTRYFPGALDDVRIYDCILDEIQIKSLVSLSPLFPSLPSLNPLSDVLDTDLSFTTGGDADWFTQRATSFYDGDAAQSGNIKFEQESWLQTTVSGKGTVSFSWKVSSEDLFDVLEFYIDGWLQDKISGSKDWHQMTYEITDSDVHVLEWRYVKDVGTDSGSDCGWVDKVVWTPAP